VNEYPRIAGVHYESVVDGVGVRTVIFFAGCTHNCLGCQNADIQDQNAGQECNEEMIQQIADEILKRDFLSGITLSGGDPLYDPKKTLNFVLQLSKDLGDKLHIKRRKPFDIWIYTGATWEDLIAVIAHDTSYATSLWLLLRLDAVSVLVDGEFIQSQADKRLAFRGSRNQRLIDVRKSLQRPEGPPVIWKKRQR